MNNILTIYGTNKNGTMKQLTNDQRNTLLAAVRAYQSVIETNVSASPDSTVAWLEDIATDDGGAAPTMESLDALAEEWLGGA